MHVNKYQTGHVSTTGYSSYDISCGPVVGLVDCSLFSKGIWHDTYEEHGVYGFSI